jgi:hypothetical protein
MAEKAGGDARFFIACNALAAAARTPLKRLAPLPAL